MQYAKPQIHRLLGVGALTAFLGLFMMESALGQGGPTKVHNLGDYQLRIYSDDFLNTNDTRAVGTGVWPQDHYRYSTVVFYNSGFTVGSWVDENGDEHSKEVFLYPLSFNQEEPYGIREVRRAEPPLVEVYTEGAWIVSSRSYTGDIDQTLPSDMMIEVRYKAQPGFDILKRSYSFSNPDHDDYVIHVNRYLTTFDWDADPEADTDDTQTLEDVYFVFGYAFQTAEGTWITYERWYEDANSQWADYDYQPSTLVEGGRDLHVSYSWDGDHPEITEFEEGGPDFDDTGDPRFAIGESGGEPMPSAEFISNAYSGFAALHVDSPALDGTDDVTQPVSIISSVNIYNVWDDDFSPFATVWDWTASGEKELAENDAGWPDDPTIVEARMPFQAFGPYDLTKGDSVVIVYAVAANGISRELAISEGLKWRSWYRGEAGADFDDAAKNDLLATGKDSLFQVLDRALWAWNQDLDIPDPLPAPDLQVESGPEKITLEWEDLSAVPDPDSGEPDLDHYVIYRKKGEFLVDTYDELDPSGVHILWEEIATVDGSTTSYEDTDVSRGDAYHYAVTAVDDQGLESSKYANRSEVAAYSFAPGRADADSVRIIPNPYIVRAGDFNFAGDDNKLLFVNLPAYCTLRIYTATGDLIKTIEHSSGSADESWDQVTKANQLVASGVYILQVDDAEDLDGNSLPGAIEKFVIIR
ncbi:MAG: fibronectin type III domain-containing protein [Fidelibacterota bacterium]|nr:MAG: fibronectin type III domain-containing protein [Candidatus Neomarinimicrobiota bacterium]